MHSEAFQWVQYSFDHWFRPGEKLQVLEFGSLDINGSVRPIFMPHAREYVGVDLQAGPGVDVIAGAHEFRSESLFDVVVCCEVFEHTPVWRDIITNAYQHLKQGGLFIATMAGETRRPHSAIDENPIRDWEYYDNIGVWELRRHLNSLFSSIEVNTAGSDLRCFAVK